jgi:hypothetical protein
MKEKEEKKYHICSRHKQRKKQKERQSGRDKPK